MDEGKCACTLLSSIFSCMICSMKKILLLLLLYPFSAFAISDSAWTKFDFEFDQEKPWVELQSQLPAYPKEENYLPFFVSATAVNQFFVDARSISIGEDGVVRYTLIVKSPYGAVNVSFEGVRCGSGELKLYAFGRSDGTWSRARTASWESIEYKDINRHHHMLHDDFLCVGHTPVRSVEEIVKKLKAGYR